MHSIAFFIRPLCSLRSRKRFNGADADTVLCNRAAATMLLREKETSYVLLGSANALLSKLEGVIESREHGGHGDDSSHHVGTLLIIRRGLGS
jgi:hypothetical protein